MSVRTKTRHIKATGSRSKVTSRKGRSQEQRKKTPWRDVAKKEITQFSEPGVMLRGCRYKHAITQSELATAIDVSQHHISEMENGKRPIGKEMAKRLADFFNTDYQIFL